MRHRWMDLVRGTAILFCQAPGLVEAGLSGVQGFGGGF